VLVTLRENVAWPQRPSDILAPPDPFELPGTWQNSTDAASGTLQKYMNLVPSAVMQIYCERQPAASSILTTVQMNLEQRTYMRDC
jgi:hypothetical protein